MERCGGSEVNDVVELIVFLELVDDEAPDDGEFENADEDAKGSALDDRSDQGFKRVGFVVEFHGLDFCEDQACEEEVDEGFEKRKEEVDDSVEHLFFSGIFCYR